MFKLHNFDSSYLPISELVSLGLVIGLGTAIIEYIYSIYLVMTSDWVEFPLAYFISELTNFILSPIFGALGAIAVYPPYKTWALNKNGLKMSVFVKSSKL